MPSPLLFDPTRRCVRLDERAELPADDAGHVRFRADLSTPPRVERGRTVTRADGDETDERAEAIGFVGHAALFGSPTWIGRRYGFWEQIAKGAFAESITEDDVRFLINHDANLLLARNREAETLRLAEDDKGLAVDADMSPTTYAQDLAINLEWRVITQMSFAFDILEYEYAEADDGESMYTITKARLWDVAVVTYPAYTDTDAALRAADLVVDTTPLLGEPLDARSAAAFHQLLRRAGLEPAAIDDLARRLAVPTIAAPTGDDDVPTRDAGQQAEPLAPFRRLAEHRLRELATQES